ncbi:MAG: alpha/beta hydrolase, partial [Myxococcota bacterium]
MLPSYFGDSERALFGLCVPAAGERQRRSALICAPLLDEYFWAHRTCRMLGDRLAKQGIDVLRFDYYGSGDSGGESNDTRLDGAVSDTLIALQELRDFSQNRRTTLIGMRLGAVVAARATLRSNHVDRLVLWDPVCDGREWVADLEARANVARDQRMDLNGLPVSAELLERDQRVRNRPVEPGVV